MTFQNAEPMHGAWAVVRERLENAAFLASCVPNATIEQANADEAAWTVPPPFGFVSQRISTTLRVMDRSGDRVTLAVENRATGASLLAEGELRFREPFVEWTATVVKITGLLKMVPGSVLRSQGEKLIAELWLQIHERLQE